MEAVEEISNLMDTLSIMREKIDEFHKKWFEEIEKMCESVGVQHLFLDSAAGKDIVLMFPHRHHWSTIDAP